MSKACDLIKFIESVNFGKTLEVINSLVEEGLIRDYAVIGGYALSFYTEPFLTYDLDIAILADSGNKIFDMSEIYSYLKDLGYMHKDEYVVIEGVPVQFIIPKQLSLMEDAVVNAKIIKYKSVDIKVISLEYLIAIILDTNRPKDKLKLVSLYGQIKKIVKN